MDHTVTTASSTTPERQRGWKAEWVRQFISTRPGTGTELKIGDVVREFRRLYPDETLTHANVLSALGGRQPHELSQGVRDRSSSPSPASSPAPFPPPSSVPSSSENLVATNSLPVETEEPSLMTDQVGAPTVHELKEVLKLLKSHGWRAIDLLDFMEGRDPETLMRVLKDIDELGVG